MKENKLIAEFEQLPTEVFKPNDIMNYHHDGAWYEEHELSYEKSWDWLIPVVDKCFQEEGKHYLINDALLTINIDEVYEAVVKFIKEYNKVKRNELQGL